MGEQHIGVDTQDPDAVVSNLSVYLASTHDALWNQRWSAAALGRYQALNGETPPDTSYSANGLLDEAQETTLAIISTLREQGILVFLFDSETEGWYHITGVGTNAESLSLVAQVYDPDDPNSLVTKWLGPTTQLTYLLSENTDAKRPSWLPGPVRNSTPAISLPGLIEPPDHNKLPLKP